MTNPGCASPAAYIPASSPAGAPAAAQGTSVARMTASPRMQASSLGSPPQKKLVSSVPAFLSGHSSSGRPKAVYRRETSLRSESARSRTSALRSPVLMPFTRRQASESMGKPSSSPSGALAGGYSAMQVTHASMQKPT